MNAIAQRIAERRIAEQGLEALALQLRNQAAALHRGVEAAYAHHKIKPHEMHDAHQNVARALDRLEADARGGKLTLLSLRAAAQRVLDLEQQASWDLADEEGAFPEEHQVEQLTTEALKALLRIAAAANIPLRIAPRPGL